MEALAVVIVNYNKKDDIIKCMDSVFRSTYQNVKIIVVDNASTDDSVDAIKKAYEDKVQLIENKVNTGGAGGFCTGMKEALSGNYQYMMLLDNDVVLDEKAIEYAVSYLESHKDTALVGSKLYSMDKPDMLQELGADIDFENFTIKPKYKNYVDDGKIPDVVLCDYVPVCSAVVRTDAVRVVGLMDETNFIYWDDIEWGKRFKNAGYQVVAYGKSMAFHKMGSESRANTFATYYFWRNKIKFFTQYLQKEDLKKFCEQFLKELFQATYACLYQEKYKTIQTLMFAYDDALNGAFGVASDGRIFDADVITDKIAENFAKDKSCAILFNGDYRTVRRLIHKLQEVNRNIRVTIVANGFDAEAISGQFPHIHVSQEAVCDKTIAVCKHIFEVDNPEKNMIYADEYLNVIVTERDREYCKNYELLFTHFYHTQFPLMYQKLLRLKSTLFCAS